MILSRRSRNLAGFVSRLYGATAWAVLWEPAGHFWRIMADLKRVWSLRSLCFGGGGWRGQHGWLARSAGLGLLAAVVLWTPCAAGDTLGTLRSDDNIANGEVTGQVALLSAHAIHVEYTRPREGSFEVIIPIGKETRLAHLRSLSELRTGDTVRVQYRQTYRDGEDGQRFILRSVATQIALVKRATPDALDSKERETP